MGHQSRDAARDSVRAGTVEVAESLRLREGETIREIEVQEEDGTVRRAFLVAGGALESEDSDETFRPCASCGEVTSKRCSACHKVHYCSRECQVEGWGAHKAQCKAIREEAQRIEAFTVALTAKKQKRLDAGGSADLSHAESRGLELETAIELQEGEDLLRERVLAKVRQGAAAGMYISQEGHQRMVVEAAVEQEIAEGKISEADAGERFASLWNEVAMEDGVESQAFESLEDKVKQEGGLSDEVKERMLEKLEELHDAGCYVTSEMYKKAQLEAWAETQVLQGALTEEAAQKEKQTQLNSYLKALTEGQEEPEAP
ncbi:unnamed protein product [Chrysoparadoxa australica]